MKKKTKKYFWKIYILCVVISIIAMVSVWTVLWVALTKYEKNQPKHTMDKIISCLEEGKTDEIAQYISFPENDFEEREAINKSLNEYLKGDGEWSYNKKYGEYKDDTPVYQLRKNGKSLGLVYLKKAEGEGEFVGAGWDIESITDICINKNTYTITAPADAVVTVNGKLLGDKYITKRDIQVDLLENMSAYITLPTKVEYTVEGLVNEPDIRVNGNVFNEDIEAVVTDNCYEYGFETNDDFVQKVSSRTQTVTQAYCDYVGAAKSVKTLTQYYIPGSNGYNLLSGSAEGFKWNFYSDYNVDIKEIGDYQVYSKDCFSCKSSIHMSVKRGYTGRDYDVVVTFVFYNKGGSWMVADFTLE